jgi:hypothetical protein
MFQSGFPQEYGAESLGKSEQRHATGHGEDGNADDHQGIQGNIVIFKSLNKPGIHQEFGNKTVKGWKSAYGQSSCEEN